MDTPLRPRGIYLFNRFRLDAARRSLTRDGTPVPLSPRVFDTLLYLVENHDRLVEKDELLNAVWSGRFVEEANLSQTIFVLRKALRDAGEETNPISTVSGHGYCFSATVRRDQELSAHAAEAKTPDSIDGVPAAPNSVESRTAARVFFERLRGPSRGFGAALISAGVLMTAVIVFVVLRYLPASVEQHASPFHPAPRSVAVLAFANMSGDPGQDYLADGFAEELISALGGVSELHVADRASAFYFKNHPATVAEIARRLNVGAVLEGSVRRQGSRLRITAELTNATTGYQFWSRSYDRDFGDILNLQREIAENVTQSLLATLRARAPLQMPMGGTNNSSAFDDFLRGLRFMNGRDEPSYRSSLAAFDQAVRLDPDYARAQVMRAYVLMFLAAFGTATDRNAVRDTLQRALDAANRSVLLAPGWGESYAAKGAILLTMLDFAGAERELLRARSLAPDDIGVDRPYAYLESYLGHPAAAEVAAARVVARYPADGSGYWDQARVYYLDRHYQDSLAASRHGSALAAAGPPGGAEATSALAWLALGRADVAARICAPNRTWEETACLAIAAHRLGNIAEAQSRLVALRALLGDRGAYNYAQIYAQWGKPEDALAWLATAWRLHDTGIVQLKVDPLMDPIRARPEFADIEHRLNFPP